jgi:hypothetical protein
VRKAGYGAAVVVLLGIGASYWLLGCGRDWVIIGGLVIDVIGALLIASPDLKSFRERSYEGQLQQAYDAELIDRSAHFIPKQIDWYPVFLSEMDDAFHRPVTESSEFFIEEQIDTYNIFHRPKPGVDAQRMSVSVMGEQMRDTIDAEDSRIRRAGAALLNFWIRNTNSVLSFRWNVWTRPHLLTPKSERRCSTTSTHNGWSL